MPNNEPIVDISAPMPHGYTHIRSGSVYITKNCRRLTHERGAPVYLVHDMKGQLCGIRVPIHIWKKVRELNDETRESRKAAVQKKDAALANKVKLQLLKLFPKVPGHFATEIVDRMIKKRSGRVGRSTKLDIQAVVKLGVRAHIRHSYTDYDEQLKKGLDREVARRNAMPAILEMENYWALSSSSSSSIKHKQSLRVPPRDAGVTFGTTTKNVDPVLMSSGRRTSLRLKEKIATQKTRTDV